MRCLAGLILIVCLSSQVACAPFKAGKVEDERPDENTSPVVLLDDLVTRDEGPSETQELLESVRPAFLKAEENPLAQAPASLAPIVRQPPPVIEVPEADTRFADIQADVSCGSKYAQDCPQAVGYLLAKTVTDGKPGVFQCTSFLIDSQTVLTNSHCIPESIHSDGADCHGEITIHFPDVPGARREFVGCETVLKVSTIPSPGDNSMGHLPDYAVLRLAKPVRRSPFKVSREGMPDAFGLTVFAVDPQSTKRLEGKLVKKRCESVQKTAILPEYGDDFAPVATFGECGIIQGNSGSPAVDRAGQVRAIVFATLEGGAVLENKQVKPVDAERFQTMALMANAACWDLPSGLPIASRDARCDQSRTANGGLDDLLKTADEKFYDGIYAKWEAENSGQLRYKRKYSRDPRMHILMLSAEFECVKHPKAFQESELSGTDVIVVPFRLPLWVPNPVIDSKYKRKLEPIEAQAVKGELTFNSKALAKDGSVVADMKVLGADGQTTAQQITLKLCSDK